MNAFDPDLLRALADADAQSPPPVGSAVTPHALLAVQTRRTRRQLAALATLTLLALGLVLAWPRPRSRDDAQDNDERLQQQVAALRADLARLQAQLAAIAPTFAPPPLPLPLPVEDRALADLRYELANARADAALAALPAPLKEHR